MLAVLVTIFPIAASAQGVAPPAPSTSAISARASQLAAVVSPHDQYVAAEMAGAKQGFDGSLDANPELRQFGAEHPGLYAHLWKAVEPVFRTSLSNDHPLLLRRLADIYARQLTIAEVETLIRFYRSPTGMKLIAAMYRTPDLSSVMSEITSAAADGSDVPQSTLNKIQADAARRATAELGEEDKPTLEALGRELDLAKMNGISVQTKQVMLDWVNRADPALDARVETVVEDAMIAFLSGTKGK